MMNLNLEKMTNPKQTKVSTTHQSLSTQQAREAHTEKAKNLRHPSSHQQDNTVPLLLLAQNNRRTWVPQLQLSQPPLLALAPLLQLQPSPHLPPLLPLPQLPQYPPEEQLSPELKTTLEMLWQPLCEGQALGLHLAVEEEVVEEAVEGEEVEVEDNRLLSLHSNSSLSPQPPIYESWGRFPESLKEKETRPTPS